MCLCAAMVTLSGCAARITPPVRAIWVTRFDYKTAEDVEQIMADCADAGFNAVLFQVRGNATAFYRSELEPWADELGGEDPGFDPLALACEAAHERDMELHAWVNVMPAWRGVEPPTNPKQLYNARPEWFWYDQHGKRQALQWFYVSVNPCLPEVRQYLVDVFREIVAGYDVDGLHLDYVRFPDEPPAIPRGSDIDYPRDERTLALYKAATGLSPDDDDDAWDQWRTDQVTQLVIDIHDMMRRTKPRAALTASVGSTRGGKPRHYRDADRWVREALVDAAFLMNYTDSPETFQERIEPWLADPPPVPVIPGLWFGRHRGKSVEEAAQAVLDQVEIANVRVGSFCVFAYASLFDSANDELEEQSDEEVEKRAKRREILLPYLRHLAGT
jgi:uncharacterized lipoprotein YddW (UPF0748 family)